MRVSYPSLAMKVLQPSLSGDPCTHAPEEGVANLDQQHALSAPIGHVTSPQLTVSIPPPVLLLLAALVLLALVLLALELLALELLALVVALELDVALDVVAPVVAALVAPVAPVVPGAPPAPELPESKSPSAPLTPPQPKRERTQALTAPTGIQSNRDMVSLRGG